MQKYAIGNYAFMKKFAFIDFSSLFTLHCCRCLPQSHKKKLRVMLKMCERYQLTGKLKFNFEFLLTKLQQC